MRKLKILVLVIIVVAACLLIISTITSTSSDNIQPKTSMDSRQKQSENTIIIKDMNFTPHTLTIQRGTTLIWTNHDAVSHTVSAEVKGSKFPASPPLSQGQSYSFTFNEPGTFKYHCSIHPEMQAIVIVK